MEGHNINGTGVEIIYNLVFGMSDKRIESCLLFKQDIFFDALTHMPVCKQDLCENNLGLLQMGIIRGKRHFKGHEIETADPT